jgi:MFS family permease
LFAAVYAFDFTFTGQIVLAAAGQSLHGFCFGCFLAAAYIYVDRLVTTDLRGSMQTLYGVFIIASGFFAGSIFGGEVGKYFTVPGSDPAQRNWTMIWLTCAAICGACVAALVLFFPSQDPKAADQA